MMAPGRMAAPRPAGPTGHRETTAHPVAGPTGPASVVLDVGAGTGTLVIYTGPEWCGREIEVSPTDDGAGPACDGTVAGGGTDRGGRRVHAEVRERLVRPRPRYAAVIAGLPAGRYTVWRDAGTPLGTVEVAGGVVTEYLWPDSVFW